jgi:hypothetical protein
MGDNDISPQPDEFCREFGGAIRPSSGVADLQRNVLTVKIAKSSEASAERICERVRRRHTSSSFAA